MYCIYFWILADVMKSGKGLMYLGYSEFYKGVICNLHLLARERNISIPVFLWAFCDKFYETVTLDYLLKFNNYVSDILPLKCGASWRTHVHWTLREAF